MAAPKTYAIVQNGKVVDVVSTAIDPKTIYTPDLVPVDISKASPAPAMGWSYASGVFSAPAGPTLQATQVAKIRSLTASCAAQITGGYTSSALGAAYTYPGALTDQTNMAASVIASLLPGLAAGWTTPFPCADSSGAWAKRDHTVAQIQQAGSDGKAAVIAAQTKLDTLVAEVNAAVTNDAVNAITW